MRGRTLLLLLVVVGVVAGVVALGGGGAVHAQIAPVPVTPPYCGSLEPYDLTNDGRLDWRDFDLWVRTVHGDNETCRLDGPASGCPSWVDVNGDTVVSVLDLQAMDQFMMWCVFPPKNTAPRPSL